MTGFVAIDHCREYIIVSFRGSKSVRNWGTDFEFIPVQTDLCDTCNVHAGFADCWNDARPGVISSVVQSHNDWPDYQLVVTGHSLGAAIATLAAAALRRDGHSLELVGTIPVRSLRFTHRSEPVHIRLSPCRQLRYGQIPHRTGS